MFGTKLRAVFARSDSTSRAAPSEEEIRSWLILEVGRRLHLPPEEVNTEASLLEYGLDSLQATAISGGLEKLLHVRLSPALIWDHPTIDELVRHLSAGTQ